MLLSHLPSLYQLTRQLPACYLYKTVHKQDRAGVRKPWASWAESSVGPAWRRRLDGDPLRSFPPAGLCGSGLTALLWSRTGVAQAEKPRLDVGGITHCRNFPKSDCWRKRSPSLSVCQVISSKLFSLSSWFSYTMHSCCDLPLLAFKYWQVRPQVRLPKSFCVYIISGTSEKCGMFAVHLWFPASVQQIHRDALFLTIWCSQITSMCSCEILIRLFYVNFQEDFGKPLFSVSI